MNLITLITIAVLMIMSFFHIYWVFGGKLGLDKALPTTLDGRRLIDPSKFLTFMVALILTGFSFVAYMLHFMDVTDNMYIYSGWFVSAVFIVRSIGDFNTVGFFKKIRSTEFAKYDTRYFSPLCLYLGIYFALSAYSAVGNG